MPSHASVAAKVRAHKEAHPEKFCPNPRCLWQRGGRPCPKHTDVLVENHGSIVLVRPINTRATAWLASYTDGTWFGHALAVEPRYVENLVVGLREDGGFIVEASCAQV